MKYGVEFCPNSIQRAYVDPSRELGATFTPI
jgi:hypothetical protein